MEMLLTKELEISKRRTGLLGCKAVDAMLLWDGWECTNYFVKSHSIGEEQAGPEQGLQAVLPMHLLNKAKRG